MIAILGLILPALGNLFPALFTYLGKKQDINLSGAQSAMGADVELGKATLAAQIQAEQIKAANNAWIGPKIIACLAGELCVFYFGAIVLDSVFHMGRAIAKLPPPGMAMRGSSSAASSSSRRWRRCCRRLRPG